VSCRRRAHDFSLTLTTGLPHLGVPYRGQGGNAHSAPGSFVSRADVSQRQPSCWANPALGSLQQSCTRLHALQLLVVGCCVLPGYWEFFGFRRHVPSASSGYAASTALKSPGLSLPMITKAKRITVGSPAQIKEEIPVGQSAQVAMPRYSSNQYQCPQSTNTSCINMQFGLL
jgi:hypothetical protein